jgi:pyridoxal phosphate enzyme (YggS family)
MPTLHERLAENLAAVRRRIDTAADAASRAPEEITLVAVTKYVDAEVARALFAAGCADLAESRPQELWSKAAALADLPVRWHLIGHLQRNKVRRTLPLTTLIHAIDSERLLAEMDAEAAAQGRPADVLLEVHISGEAAKQGIEPAELAAVVQSLTRWAHVRVHGLMGMAPLEGRIEAARQSFDLLRALRDELAPQAPPGVQLRELSMGMSGDLEQAVAAGATLVRVGSALFEGLPR